MVTERRQSLTGGGILCSRKTEIYLLHETNVTTEQRYFQQCHAQQQEHNNWMKKANVETH